MNANDQATRCVVRPSSVHLLRFLDISASRRQAFQTELVAGMNYPNGIRNLVDRTDILTREDVLVSGWLVGETFCHLFDVF